MILMKSSDSSRYNADFCAAACPYRYSVTLRPLSVDVRTVSTLPWAIVVCFLRRRREGIKRDPSVTWLHNPNARASTRSLVTHLSLTASSTKISFPVSVTHDPTSANIRALGRPRFMPSRQSSTVRKRSGSLSARKLLRG